MSKPKVLISDALSPAAVQIFRDRGVDVDFQPNLGKDKDKLAEIIGDYDGLAIRSATKATAKIIDRAKKLKVIGRAGIGVDNMGSWQDVQAAISRALAGGQLLDRELDAMPLDHSAISINLRTGIPVVAVKGGILN